MRRINRSIRFSDEEFDAITKAAETAGVERSKFIRDTAVNAAEVINQGSRPKVVYKFREGFVGTHSAGRVLKVWRLLDDGTLLRTNSKSKYVQPFASERIPEKVLEYAKQNGLTIKGLRPDKQGRNWNAERFEDDCYPTVEEPKVEA